MNEYPNWQGQQQQDQQHGQGLYRQPYQPQYQPVYHGVNVKDFTRSAWIAAWVGFPGLVMAIIYLREASGIKKSTGVVPQGYGCLWTVFIVYAILVLPILLVLGALVVGLIKFAFTH